jgi:very-short-patch-repair endonuclease
MGWEEWMVAAEYDGDQHRVDRWQYTKDIRRLAALERLRWIIVRVVAEDRPAATDAHSAGNETRGRNENHRAG